MRLLSIDFGTSNTVVALAVEGQAARAITFDASPLLPSAVYLAADGTVTVGRDAQRQARLDPTRFEPNPKRRIDDGEVLLGDRVVEVVDLIAAVLRTVATEVRRQLGGGLPDEVRLTHPAQWGATRQNTLTSAARKAGLGNNLVLIPEPVAAAAQYTRLPGRELRPGGSVAVYDLGGGTLDIAVVGRTRNEFHVLAEAGLPDLGGLDFDQAVLEHVGRTASSADPGRWQQILRPADAPSRRAARSLAEDVKAAKETLSRYPQTEVALPEPFTDVHLTRPEFEGLIRPNLLRSIEVLQATLRSAGVGATADNPQSGLAGIFLVGGSSRVPLVAKLISDQLGVTPVALDQPETAVALGALLVPTHSEGGRTVAYGDTPRGQGPASGGHHAAPPGSGPQHRMTPGAPVSGRNPTASPSGPQPTGAQQAGPQSGPHSGGHRTGPYPAGTGSYRPPDLPHRATKSRKPLLIGGSVLALLVVIAVVLIVVKPFSPSADPGPDTTGTSSGEQSPASSGGSGSVGGSTPQSPADPAGDEPGVGPDDQMTPNELAFLGDAANSKLVNCGDNTETLKDALPAEYAAQRILGCEVAGTDDPESSELYGRTLMYVFTLDSPEAADTLMDQVTTDREGEIIGDDPSGSTETSVGSLRLVAAAQLPPMGTDDQGEGRPALAWSLADERYVAMMVSLKYTATSDLVDYFEKHYKPR